MYQRCSAATLTTSFAGVDTGVDYQFEIEPYGFTCVVGVLWDAGGHNPFSGGLGAGYCGSVRLEANGLRVFDCQRTGTIFVPGGA